MRVTACLFLLLLPNVLFAQNPASDQDANDDERVQDTGRPFQIDFKNRPSIRIGEFANVDFKAKWHFDFLGFDPPTILPNGERTWTIGPTWYLNHFIKVQVHGQQEHLTDIERKAIFGETKFLTGVIRLQLAM